MKRTVLGIVAVMGMVLLAQFVILPVSVTRLNTTSNVKNGQWFWVKGIARGTTTIPSLGEVAILIDPRTEERMFVVSSNKNLDADRKLSVAGTLERFCFLGECYNVLYARWVFWAVF